MILSAARHAEEKEFGDERVSRCCKSIAVGLDAKGVAERVVRAGARMVGWDRSIRRHNGGCDRHRDVPKTQLAI